MQNKVDAISRQGAIAKGLNTYRSNKLCRFGHDSERYVVGRCCITCSKERGSAWYRKFKRRARASRRLRLYNITDKQYYELLRKQFYKCAICGKHRKNSRNRCLSVDHDHTCCSTPAKSCGNCIRGLLCDACNSTVGFYERYKNEIDLYLSGDKSNLFSV